MSHTAQKRAVKNFRSRLQKKGFARFEVLGLDTDRNLIRSLAKRLAQGDPEASRIRLEMMRTVADVPQKGWRVDAEALFRAGISAFAAWRCVPQQKASDLLNEQLRILGLWTVTCVRKQDEFSMECL